MYESDYAIITKRVADILQLLDLTECKDEKVENYSINSSEVRRLNIAVEIVGLPPLIVIDEPTVGLEPAHAMAVFASLRAIASRGHIVICAMMRPTSQLFVHVDRAIVLSAGKSIFSAETKYIRQHFTNLGYVYKNEESKLSDFVLDIASGTERPDSQRVSFSPAELQQSFEKSAYFSNPVSGVRSLHALPRKSFLSDYFTAKYRLLFSIHDGCNMIRRQFDHMIVIIHRALKAKRNDVETIKRTFGGAILLGLGLGYLQWQIGNYGDNSLTIIKMTYANTANLTSLLFFVGTLTFSLNVVLIQSLCERVHVFRHEQKMGYQTAISFLVSSAIADGPFSVAAIVVFATTAYFMAALNTGVSNFAYFILAIMCLSVVGLFSAYLFTLLFRKELRVRDSFLFCTFFMLLTSGYLFPLPTLDSNIAKLVALSPIRWFFEAMMHWKFANNYVDGTVYLEVYDYQDFDSDSYFPIMSYFIIFSVCSAYLAAWPNIYTLQRRKDVRTELLEGSGTWDSGRASATFFQDALLNLDSPVGKSQPSSLRRSISETSEAPILFERRPSMSSVARLSVNLSLRGDPEAQTQFRGPTIVFKDLCYSVRNPSASQGYLSVLNNVSGQFDWGKLSLVLGARGSGRSSLLHILAGSRGIAAKVSGVVRFDGEPIDRSTPLWQRCGLVEASDELHGDLTVEDILRFAMQLRCPNLEAFAYVEENVTRTISLLHLDQVRKTRAKRLTNGELKRLSIAEELVHGPGLLLIDEPTTSQDLRDESIMLQTFRELVNQDRTVVASIQTPSERILQLFDVVLLLSKGSVIYHGPMANADKFFTSSPYKFSLNAYDNRGDFLTDISGGYLECADGTIPGSRDLATYFSSGKVSTADETVDDSYNGNSNEKDSLTASNSRRNSKIPTRQSKELTKDDMLVSAKAMLEEPLIPVEKSTSKTLRSQIYKAVPLIYMLPHIIAACIMSMWSYITQLPSTDWDLTLRQSSVIIRRSFLSMYRRKKLWITSIVTYIFLACLLGLLAGNVVLQAYVTISLYAIGPLLLFFTNIQIVYYTFRTDMVSN